MTATKRLTDHLGSVHRRTFKVDDLTVGDLVLLHQDVRLWRSDGSGDDVCGPDVMVAVADVTCQRREDPSFTRTHVYLLSDGSRAVVSFPVGDPLAGIGIVQRIQAGGAP